MAALRALRFVENRRPTGRRFGPDADAQWKAFRGDLATADRIDLLIRDADAEWPGAFGPRVVYNMKAVSEDEAFGAEWEPLEPVAAEELWRSVLQESAPDEPRVLFEALAEAWELSLSPVSMKEPTPTDAFVVAGPSAIMAATLAFAGREDLDWCQQVIVVATPPSHRQFAALAAAVLKATKATQVYTAQESADLAGPSRIRIAADDAEPADAEAAAQLGKES